VTLGAACVVALWPSPTPAVAIRTEPRAATERAWAPPAWFPEEVQHELWTLPALDSTPVSRAGPKIRSASAILADLDTGEILFARDPDSPRSIASLTKLFSALTLAASDVDLDRDTCVGIEQWPSRSGGRTKLDTGSCHQGWEYLGAALVASDNRGAFTLPAVAGEEYFTFVDRMTDVAADLGARTASFADPAGLEDENMASARDVLKAVVAVAAHPELSVAASASSWRLDTGKGPRILRSTNRLAERYETLAAKTGYTDTARFCFADVVRTRSGRRLAAVVLGAPNSGARFADTTALLAWAESR
jgi:serine-type D-Ala-D-Ala endopeptidase (penicillin-binding protein 7)